MRYSPEALDFASEGTEDEPDICPTCNGSGEGTYDGSTCPSCKGQGEILTTKRCNHDIC